uniref:Tumor protein p63 regulated 1 n=1 Tax=Salmo trutta TaxID=8032 RepID=A0A673X7J6_SALTR
MSEDKTVTLKPVDLVEPESWFSSSHLDPTHTSHQPPALEQTDLQALDSGHPGTEEKGPVGLTIDAEAQGNRWTSTLDQFKLKRFFVLRPGTMDQALEDIKSMVNQDEDGDVHGVWLMTEREGEGVRVFWDRLREPSFLSKWNPFTTDYPFSTFTYHPVRNIDHRFTALCEIQSFREQLTEAAQKAHLKKPIPGKANGVLVLNQPLLIESYVGLMSFIGNQNKLGYCLARGNIGF